MSRGSALGFVLAVALGVFGCRGQERSTCVASVAQPIFNRQATPLDAGLTAAESLAIGAIEDEEGRLLCSAVALGPHALLTAAHCSVSRARLRLVVPPAAPVRIELGEFVRHPTVDLAIVEVLAPEELEAVSVRPLPLRTTQLDENIVSTRAILAGVGRREDAEEGQLDFVEESIVAIDATTIRVDGFGLTGACTGDSGGPLLARRNDGLFEVLGILSVGSLTCRGIDVYTRVDAQIGWIRQSVTDPCVPPR